MRADKIVAYVKMVAHVRQQASIHIHVPVRLIILEATVKMVN